MMLSSKSNSVKGNIFTVIVTYNGMHWIKECLDSVYLNSTVILVDNCSSDNTISFITKNYEDVLVLKQDENLGFGKANNLGISHALSNGADYILLLNQDAKMIEGSIDKLFNFAKVNSDYGILSPVHCDWSGNYLESSFSSYVSYVHNKEFYSDFVLNRSIKPVYDLPFVAAACWFIPKKVFETIGGFDPIFFHLGEDVNYAQRLSYYGYKIGVLPDIKVHHDTKDRKSIKIEPYSKDYYYKINYRNKVKYADINLDNWKTKLNYNKRQVLKTVILSLASFKFKNAKGAYKEYVSYNSLSKECDMSRMINKEPGSHYLS
ncbi:glycosyltransferase family 2 protein [Winogradskyella sp. PE311]|uniref:glycosyltransferase family 2 protein n=1 Tax=Winogradskyella sp. PE311 TaxID=3366943 RepID=UPI003980B8F4